MELLRMAGSALKVTLNLLDGTSQMDACVPWVAAQVVPQQVSVVCIPMFCLSGAP